MSTTELEAHDYWDGTVPLLVGGELSALRATRGTYAQPYEQYERARGW